jgi:hypothetical protein
LLLCLLSTTTTTSTTAKKKRRFDIKHYFTTIDGVIHDVASGRSFDCFLLNLVDVDPHNIIFSTTSPIIMIGISDYDINSRRLGIISEDHYTGFHPSIDYTGFGLSINYNEFNLSINYTGFHLSIDHTGFDVSIETIKNSSNDSSILSPVPSLEPSLISSTTVQSSPSTTVPRFEIEFEFDIEYYCTKFSINYRSQFGTKFDIEYYYCTTSLSKYRLYRRY